MTPNDEPPPPPKPQPAPKPRRKREMDEALANIRAYVDDLRELIKKLRGPLH